MVYCFTKMVAGGARRLFNRLRYGDGRCALSPKGAEATVPYRTWGDTLGG
jgi:hypothetical protein